MIDLDSDEYVEFGNEYNKKETLVDDAKSRPLTETIEKILFDLDPKLLSLSNQTKEYAVEASKIVHELKLAEEALQLTGRPKSMFSDEELHDIVYAVFVITFGYKYAGNYDKYKDVAAKIHSVFLKRSFVDGPN